eukprot:754969-Hanusia_phi.AAC.1
MSSDNVGGEASETMWAGRQGKGCRSDRGTGGRLAERVLEGSDGSGACEGRGRRGREGSERRAACDEAGSPSPAIANQIRRSRVGT